mgnify:CR=1 FL=1
MIKIIAVGKIKEKYLSDAVNEYSKRINAYTRLNIIQVNDESCPERASGSVMEQVKMREGQRILDNISDKDYVITLEIKGRKLSSEHFAEHMESLRVEGRSDVAFVIGGSLGLSPEVSARADFKLSFSDMTFPHQLMRVILLEQIYRSYKIARNEPYHK